MGKRDFFLTYGNCHTHLQSISNDWKVCSSLSCQTVITLPFPTPGTAQTHGQPRRLEKPTGDTNSQYFCMKCLGTALWPFLVMRIKFKHNLKDMTSFKTKLMHTLSWNQGPDILNDILKQTSKYFLQRAKTKHYVPQPLKDLTAAWGFASPNPFPDFTTT